MRSETVAYISPTQSVVHLVLLTSNLHIETKCITGKLCSKCLLQVYAYSFYLRNKKRCGRFALSTMKMIKIEQTFSGFFQYFSASNRHFDVISNGRSRTPRRRHLIESARNETTPPQEVHPRKPSRPREIFPR